MSATDGNKGNCMYLMQSTILLPYQQIYVNKQQAMLYLNEGAHAAHECILKAMLTDRSKTVHAPMNA